MSKQEVILCKELESSLTQAIEKCSPDRLFVLTDEHTHRLCLPQIKDIPVMRQAQEIVIGAEDVNKTLETLAQVWQALSQQGATRHSLLINLGGGMVTDLGGFAAATFKRGIAYINIPTTLLAMVDASVGGKTGINFNGLKNEIGAFAPANCVLLETEFLRSLDAHNFFSGYAEMLKHGLISTPQHLDELLAFDTEQPDYVLLKNMVGRSVQVKEDIVEQDPKVTPSDMPSKVWPWLKAVPCSMAMPWRGAWFVSYISHIFKQVFPKTACVRSYSSSRKTTVHSPSPANTTTTCTS